MKLSKADRNLLNKYSDDMRMCASLINDVSQFSEKGNIVALSLLVSSINSIEQIKRQLVEIKKDNDV